jgi:hypothetical protein
MWSYGVEGGVPRVSTVPTAFGKQYKKKEALFTASRSI